jgi:fused signal recognition particle receptor
VVIKIGFFKDLFTSKKSRIKKSKYRLGLSNKQVSSSLIELFEKTVVFDNDFYDSLEELLILSDVSLSSSLSIVDEVKKYVNKIKKPSSNDIKEAIFEVFKQNIKVKSLSPLMENPHIELYVGVNGVGKTTTIAKRAHFFMSQGHSVLIAAGDTFRAGAIEQLGVWAERLGCEFYTNPKTKDPSSVLFDAVKTAKEKAVDVVLCDTAGRLQNKKNLMEELSKMNRVLSRSVEGAPHETYLVIDATTGQNGLSQASIFNEVIDITGLILTKLDGSARGGIGLSISMDLDIPISFVGMGEQLDDLLPFDINEYLYGLFGDVFDE